MDTDTTGLNTLQKKAYDIVIKGKDKVVLVSGPAGSGKSFVTARIARDYPGSVAITATTNKSAQVLANMSQTKATTTHSFAGYTMVRQGKSQYLAPVRDSKFADLVIVEEMSMLPQSVWITLKNQLEEGLVKKVLLLGDPVQLPAIGITMDLKVVNPTVIELVEQMRQDSNLELAIYFSRFRTAIETKDYKFDPLADLPKSIVLTDSFKHFAKEYHKTSGVKKIVAYSNSVVDKYNSYINNGGFHQFDDVIIDKPMGTAKNGDTVQITAVLEHNSYYALRVLANGETFNIRHYKTKSALTEYLESADSDEEYWKRYDMCYSLKHQYACTVHKSQGSSYEHVFVDLTDIKAQVDKKPTSHNNYARPIAYNTYLRLVYVAISRMSKSATLYFGDTRTYKLLRS